MGKTRSMLLQPNGYSVLCELCCARCKIHFDTILFCYTTALGLLCFDVAAKIVYFDDGLKLSPPGDILVVVKNMLSGFELLFHTVSFQEENWNQPKLDLPLSRFNMPRQSATGEGSASCGIGVILSVRDIIIKSGACLPPFEWKFENMASLRNELMYLVVQWKN